MIKTEAYGPQIRGGESSCTVRVAADEIFAQGDTVDVLVVFRWADFARFRGEISVAPDALVLYEATEDRPSGGGPRPRRRRGPGLDPGPVRRALPRRPPARPARRTS